MKKALALAIISIFVISSVAAYAVQSDIDSPTAPPMEKTKDRLSRGMNNIFYGPVEVPRNLDQTNTKGTKVDRCSEKTRTGVERGIARFCTGVWQLATFWYSDPGTSDSTATKGRSRK